MSKLKITVDLEECIGDGLCCEEAPCTFEMSDDEKAVVKDGPHDEQDAIMDAASACPTDAIKVVDEESGEQLYPEE